MVRIRRRRCDPECIFTAEHGESIITINHPCLRDRTRAASFLVVRFSSRPNTYSFFSRPARNKINYLLPGSATVHLRQARTNTNQRFSFTFSRVRFATKLTTYSIATSRTYFHTLTVPTAECVAVQYWIFFRRSRETRPNTHRVFFSKFFVASGRDSKCWPKKRRGACSVVESVV